MNMGRYTYIYIAKVTDTDMELYVSICKGRDMDIDADIYVHSYRDMYFSTQMKLDIYTNGMCTGTSTWTWAGTRARA
jgi:hypothetical protein